MVISRSIEPIDVSDTQLEKLLESAHLPSLLLALAHDLGDLSILREDLIPDSSPAIRALGGYAPEQAEAARTVALEALKRFRDGGNRLGPDPTDDDLERFLEHMTRGELTPEYVPLLLEELDYPVHDARAPRWRKDELATEREFSAVVIGAGMSGVLAGYRLKQAGIPFTIIEKNEEVGGTWYENTYPGARVDNSNHMYSYSFAQRPDWPYFHSTQKVLHEYFSNCADEFGIRPHVRFNTEVLSADWNDDRAIWEIRVESAEGAEVLEANALIAATGQLNRPKFPDIPGQSTFAGPSFHSARWDHSVDLRGKRVAVVGSGASSSQLAPEIARDVSELLIFQRTPNWYAPVPDYQDAVSPEQLWLFTHVPRYAQWYRFWVFWTSSEGALPSARVDEGWDGQSDSIGKANDEVRLLFTNYLKEELRDRPDLLEKVLPDYPPASKRIVFDNGAWPEMLRRENVTLIADSIAKITSKGVRTDDGEEHEVDVLIYATGFDASHFLTPITIRGREGIDINEQWDGDARAYKGVLVPNFPNFFMMYGPNTNIVVNGSIVYFSECEMVYILSCLELLLRSDRRAIDCRQDSHDRYNEWIDEGNRRMAWGVARVPSWYRNEKGRTAQNWPYTLLEYWQQTHQADANDFELL